MKVIYLMKDCGGHNQELENLSITNTDDTDFCIIGVSCMLLFSQLFPQRANYLQVFSIFVSHSLKCWHLALRVSIPILSVISVPVLGLS